MGSLSRLSQRSPSENYLIYAPFCAKNPDFTISTFIECFNPSNNSRHRVTSIPNLGGNHGLKDFAMISIGHHIYILGGRLCRNFLVEQDMNNGENSDNMVLSCVRKYDVRADTWEICASMTTPRFNFACTVNNNKIYVAGGQSMLGRAKGISLTEVYDPTLNEWKSLANMGTMRYKCVGVTWQDKIHVVGGFVDGGVNQGPFVMTRSSAEVYDTERDIWNFRARMWDLDVPPNQIVTVNGKLFSSGDCFKPWKGHIEAYDEKQNLWNVVHGSHFDCLSPTSHVSEATTSNWPPIQRLYLTMTPIGNQLYFLAGYRMSGEVARIRSEVHVFDTAVNGGGWQSYEPIEEEEEKNLCGHCCILKQD